MSESVILLLLLYHGFFFLEKKNCLYGEKIKFFPYKLLCKLLLDNTLECINSFQSELSIQQHCGVKQSKIIL